MPYARLTSEDKSMAAVAGVRTSSISDASSRRSSLINGDDNTTEGLPRSAYYIVIVEGCERFCFTGLRVILLLYFMHFFHLNHNIATEYYHSILFACNFTPILGAILSDGFIGRYSTILIFAIIYCLGAFALAITAIPNLGVNEVGGPIVAFALVALGSGGIKPCVNAFGADQISGSHTRQLSQFFSFYYFAINIGALVSSILTPLIRSDVQCFHYDCYSLAFAVSAFVMLLGIVLFLIGTPLYKRVSPNGNSIAKFLAIVWRAIRNSVFRSTPPSKKYFLYHADDHYDISDIDDVRSVLNVFVLFLPTVVYHALQAQRGSRWTYQASLMDGRIGPYVTIKPDQMQVLSYILIFILLPLFERVIYPAAARLNWLIEPLQRIFVGLILTIIAFVVAAIVQEAIQQKANATPIRQHMKIYNGYNCSILINENTTLNAEKIYDFPCAKLLADDLVINSTCDQQGAYYKLTKDKLCPSVLVVSESQTATSDTKMEVTPLTNSFVKDRGVNEYGLLRLVSLHDVNNSIVKITPNLYEFNLTQKLVPTRYQSVLEATYALINTTSDAKSVNSFQITTTAVYTVLLVNTKEDQLRAVLFEDVPPFTVFMLWQIIQYIFLTASEVLVVINVLIFAYAEAPSCYKVVIISLWFITTAFGDLFVILVAEIQLTDNQAVEFVLFAIAMTLSTYIFGVLAIRYKEKHFNRPVVDSSEDQYLLAETNSLR